MIPWRGPLVAVLVAAALIRFAPGTGSCATVEAVPEAPPPRSIDSGWSGHLVGSSVDGGLPSPDPFGLAAAPPVRVARPEVASRAGTPTRPWRVTGIVGGRSAVLTREDGSSTVVTVGQRLDSARVVGITVAGVEIEDRGGRYLLKVR